MPDHESATITTEARLGAPGQKTIINWLEEKRRKSGPLAVVYHQVEKQILDSEGGGRESVMLAVEERYGSGARGFVKTRLADPLNADPIITPDVLALFCSASLCASSLPDETKAYLAKWNRLREMIGLSDNPRATFENFPLYHVGSWRAMYFATVLKHFTQLLQKPAYPSLTVDEFETDYMKELVLPVLKLFQLFFETGAQKPDALWAFVEKKISFLEDHAGWRTEILNLSDYVAQYTMANFCLPYYMRRLVFHRCEVHPLTKFEDRTGENYNWGNACANTIPILEQLIYRMAKDRNSRSTTDAIHS